METHNVTLPSRLQWVLVFLPFVGLNHISPNPASA